MAKPRKPKAPLSLDEWKRAKVQTLMLSAFDRLIKDLEMQRYVWASSWRRDLSADPVKRAMSDGIPQNERVEFPPEPEDAPAPKAPDDGKRSE